MKKLQLGSNLALAADEAATQKYGFIGRSGSGKDVLNQVEVLLAFQTNGPQERKAIAGWTAENTAAGKDMMQALPTLPIGEALVWSPQWLRIAERVKIGERDTYNASSTPTGAAKTIAPKTLAKSDLEQLGTEIKATIEKAKADDPRELKKQLAAKDKAINELEAKCAKSAGNIPANIHQKVVLEKPALTDADRALLVKLATAISHSKSAAEEAVARSFSELAQAIASTANDFMGTRVAIAKDAAEELAGLFERASVKKLLEKLNGLAIAPATSGKTGANYAGIIHKPAKPQQTQHVTRSPKADSPAAGDLKIGKCERAILSVLAQHGPCDKGKLTMLAGYTFNGSFRTALSTLRTLGLIAGDNQTTMSITDAGRASGEFDELPTGQALLAMVDLHDTALVPLPRHLVGVTALRRPGRAELDLDVIADPRRSAMRPHRARERNALVGQAQYRHHREITSRHRGRL